MFRPTKWRWNQHASIKQPSRLPYCRTLLLFLRNIVLLELWQTPPLIGFLSPLHQSPKNIAYSWQNRAYSWPRGERISPSTCSLSYWHGVFKSFTPSSTNHTIFYIDGKHIETVGDGVGGKRGRFFLVNSHQTPVRKSLSSLRRFAWDLLVPSLPTPKLRNTVSKVSE